MKQAPYCTLALAVTLLFTASVSAADSPSAKQTGAAKAPDSSQATADLLARVQEQQREIAAQRERLAAQEAEIAQQNRHIEEMNATLQELAKKVAEQSQAAAVPAPAVEQRLSELEASAKRKPELPQEVVTAGDFPGSIRIPGHSETFKVGGLARTSVIHTLQPLGSNDRFLTYTIPVGQQAPGQITRFETTAAPSRLNVEFRTPTGGLPLRAFVEGDFEGSSSAFRLRHAYLQFNDFLAGQTWSTFSDPEAEPQDLDFEGVNSRNYLRQTQLRWAPQVGRFSRLAIALEDAGASITGGTAANRWPDLILGRRWRGDAGHFFAALSIRDIRGQLNGSPKIIDEELGWAVTTSGAHTVRGWSKEDRFLFQATFGDGSARYINDLNGLGGQDAVFDTTTDKLHVLPAGGAYIAYEHHWTSWRWMPELRSTGVAGLVYVDNLDFQPDTAYHRSERYSLNLIGSPLPALDLGFELLAGRRVNKNGQSGVASQLQFMAQYRF